MSVIYYLLVLTLSYDVFVGGSRILILGILNFLLLIIYFACFPPQTRSQQPRESRLMSRDRQGGGHAYTRPEYYPQKIQDYPNKSHEYLSKLQDYNNPNETQQEYLNAKLDYPVKSLGYQSKSQEFLNKQPSDYSPSPKSQEYHGKVPDYPIKPQSYKSQAGLSRQQNMSNNNQGSNPVRERLTSPHRGVTSPPIKLQDVPRVQSPPVKMTDARQDQSRVDKLNSPVNSSNLENGKKSALSPSHNGGSSSGHFLQQYPERDNSKSQAPVWEAGYLLEKYSGGPYSPLPPVHPAAKTEKAIDEQDIPLSNDSRHGSTSSKESNLFSNSDLKYQAEKEDQSNSLMSPVGGRGMEQSKVSKVAAKLVPVRFVPDSLEVYNQQGSTQHAHLPHGPASSMNIDTVTDCGSLSKSSSDGDHNIMNRKRPPTKLKSKRRNILSFPHHLSVDELRLIQVRFRAFFL